MDVQTVFTVNLIVHLKGLINSIGDLWQENNWLCSSVVIATKISITRFSQLDQFEECITLCILRKYLDLKALIIKVI